MDANGVRAPSRKRHKVTLDTTIASPTKSGKTQRRTELVTFGINNVPLEILYEVFSYLDPHDVLRLSRATQSLRRLLLNRSAVAIRRYGMQNAISLPPKPEDMSEPLFLSLVVDSHCEVRSVASL
ncbi:hypothetical protein BDV98DRAFT_508089 [Pterulicium gracile]|uniref:F-box domain-containing protein n=1 Tax=Pterulicium gracile TaxID=1884261 RepID=A0A5C3QG39_9AGAR|nr:hypothetical protein BDV98DRAFT_508089 [Pterula gracilis]